MAHNIDRILGNKELCSDLVIKASNKLKDFSKEKMSEKTIEIYKSIMNNLEARN